ncbi:NUDIX domain-containing protein [Ornithinicoccus halotolerans]|uniref:NUDIX domain-containing protein n=1 Tax=Ornithinicoccus halotolerans TaxID=1748220 RepID=UPI0012952E92|nr:NUDIX hydrolase [Ornithinicoccus halotolerans]
MSLRAPRAGADDLADRLEQQPVSRTDTLLTGAIWTIRSDRVDLGDAGEVTREWVDHPGAVSILALRQDRGRDEVLLIQQYRHPVGSYEWELPAGLLDVEGEPPWQAAARELAEEADLRAGRWDLLAEYFSSPGGLSEAKRIYLARDLSDVPAEDRHVREAEEHGMPTRWADLDEAATAVLTGRMRNSAAHIGILSAVASRSRGWDTLRPVDLPWPAHPRLRARDGR